MKRLDLLLAPAVDAPRARVWLRSEDRAALAAPFDPSAAIVVGRLLRSEQLVPALLDGLREALAAEPPGTLLALADASLARLSAVAAHGGATPTVELLSGRDDAESLACCLGEAAVAVDAAALASAERRVVARAEEVDTAVGAHRDAWGSAPLVLDLSRGAHAWLARIAELDASTWWLDLASLVTLRTRARTLHLPALFPRAVPQPSVVRLRRSARTSQADLRVYAEVVGCEDDPARAAVERGSVIARMFDGEVEVLAIGLRADQDDLPAGLCIVRSGGGTAGIEGIELRGADPDLGHLPGESASGFWTPLPAAITGRCELLVRYGGAEEVLPLDLVR